MSFLLQKFFINHAFYVLGCSKYSGFYAWILDRKFFLKTTPIGVILTGNRLPKHENASLTLIQGMSGCIEAKIEKFSDFYEKTADSYVFLGGESIACIPEAWKCFHDPDSGSRKHFHSSGVRAIDSPHQITPKGSLVKKILKNFFEKMHTSLTVVNV